MNYQIGSTVFKDWKITRELGEGAYGKVFEIQKTNFGITTTSALKVLQVPHSQADIKNAMSEGMDEKSVTSYFQDCVNRLVREIAIMSELKSHPNIVGYEDHDVIAHTGEFGWDILIRMELLTSLPDYLRGHVLSEEEVIQIGKDLCSALMYCHKKGLIHRDIKQANIFVNSIGQFKLGDFGVSRTMEQTTGYMSKAGTESYMAPEVYLGKPYGPNVDLYSLGLVLYQLSNNFRLPFLPPAPQRITFADRENALQRRLKGEPMPTPANVSMALADVIGKACHHDPKQRYQTAGEMLDALNGLSASHTVQKTAREDSWLRKDDEEKTEATASIFGKPKTAQSAAAAGTNTKTNSNPSQASSTPNAALKGNIPVVNFERNPQGASVTLAMRNAQPGMGDVWVTADYVNRIAAGTLTNASMQVSLTNGIVWYFQGNTLKAYMTELQKAIRNGQDTIQIVNTFPKLGNIKESFYIHLLRHKDGYVHTAQYDGVTGFINRQGTSGKWHLNQNSKTSFFDDVSVHSSANPFYGIRSSFYKEPKKLTITSAIADCGAKMIYSEYPKKWIVIPAMPVDGRKFLAMAGEEIVSGNVTNIAECYLVDTVVQSSKLAIWSRDDRIIYSAMMKGSAKEGKFTATPSTSPKYRSLVKIFE